jgi:ribosomal protein S12 methylthiotransferase accessory factor
MESLEVHHAEHPPCAVRIESHRALTRQARVVDAARLPLSKNARFDPHVALPWAAGRDLVTGETVYVPFELVHANFTVPRIAGSGTFVPSTNGLGAGNHPVEAAVHGLCELVERDAEVLFRLGGEAAQRATRVAVESVDGAIARALVERLQAAGLEVMIWDMTSDVKLACFMVVVFDLESDPDFDPRPAAEGSGCHLDREIALCRALTEAAQSRLTSIAGSRDDFSTARYQGFQSKESLGHWRKRAAEPASRAFADAPDAAGRRTLDEDLATVVGRLRERGIDEIVDVDLRSSELDLAFHRFVAVGLEGSMGSPSWSPGARARARRGV